MCRRHNPVLSQVHFTKSFTQGCCAKRVNVAAPHTCIPLSPRLHVHFLYYNFGLGARTLDFVSVRVGGVRTSLNRTGSNRDICAMPPKCKIHGWTYSTHDRGMAAATGTVTNGNGTMAYGMDYLIGIYHYTSLIVSSVGTVL